MSRIIEIGTLELGQDVIGFGCLEVSVEESRCLPNLADTSHPWSHAHAGCFCPALACFSACMASDGDKSVSLGSNCRNAWVCRTSMKSRHQALRRALAEGNPKLGLSARISAVHAAGRSWTECTMNIYSIFPGYKLSALWGRQGAGHAMETSGVGKTRRIVGQLKRGLAQCRGYLSGWTVQCVRHTSVHTLSSSAR